MISRDTTFLQELCAERVNHRDLKRIVDELVRMPPGRRDFYAAVGIMVNAVPKSASTRYRSALMLRLEALMSVARSGFALIDRGASLPAVNIIDDGAIAAAVQCRLVLGADNQVVFDHVEFAKAYRATSGS